jgi:type-F conjugative transfer system secretin TraK
VYLEENLMILKPTIFRGICLMLLGNGVHAAISHELDEMKVIEVGISYEGLTRIKVKNDRILNVFGNSGDYVLEADETLGQIFIRPTASSQAFNITLITEEGHAQDLRLIPQNKAPDAVILKEGSPQNEPHKKNTSVITREDVMELLSGLKEAMIPLGYKEAPIALKKLNGPHILIRELKGEKLTGFTFEVRNDSKTAIALTEAEFSDAYQGLAVLLPKKILKPGERSHAYVITRT